MDLSPALENGTGQVYVIVLPSTEAFYPNSWSNAPIVSSWIQVTNISIDAFSGNNCISAWATDFVTNKPIKGCKLSITKKHVSDEKQEIKEDQEELSSVA